MKKVLAVTGALLLYAYPELAGLVLLLTFWENFGDLTLAVLDDRSLQRTRKALNASVDQARKALEVSLHADVNIFHAHTLAMRLKDERNKKTFRKKARAIGRPVKIFSEGLMDIMVAKKFD